MARELFLLEVLSLATTLGVFLYGEAKRRALTAAVESEKFRERRRIARELHDGAGHRMLAIVLRARQLAAHSPSTPQPLAAQAIEELAVQAQRDVREAIGCLPRVTSGSPGRAVPAPGATRSPTLSELVTGLGLDLPAGNLSVGFDDMGREHHFSGDSRHAAFRIIQEAVSNGLKHSEGPIDVRVRFGERLEISVTSGGARRSVPVLPGSGQGLLNMHRRAAELGGTLAYRELPGGRVRVIAVLPRHPSEQGVSPCGRPSLTH
ncbi:sensor histidine kinase [Streptomyces sp. NPDC051561]|uniref:sensor histidine kinase n=1 Tax=Streptomyces sp. NPDC051561 TaxID=3365658 RepID=UPI00378FC1A5